jgi:hypothetical protein
MSNLYDDPQYFARNVPGAGKNIRTAFDPEDDTSSGDETDYQLVEDVVPPKHRPKQLLNEVTPANPSSGNPAEVTQTRPMSPRRGGLNTQSRPCWVDPTDTGHERATHAFYGPNDSVPKPLCPLHYAQAQEHLAVWRSKNPDAIVNDSFPINAPVENLKIANQEKTMKDDVSALSTAMMVFHHGVSPEAPESVFGQETLYAGPGRTPGSKSLTPPEERTPAFKEAALDAALRRAREGKGGRTPKELEEIGKSEEARRDYSKGYTKNDKGDLTRYYTPLGEAAKGKNKPIGRGNYVKPKSAAPGQAPIEKVMAVAKEAKNNGTHLDKDIWHAIIENHGDGVITPEHVISKVKGDVKQRNTKPAPLKPLPIGQVGAYSQYLKTVSEATEDKPLQQEENENELWGYKASRNDAFKSDF